MAAPNPLWALIQAYMDDPKHRYRPRPADLSRETGVSDQVISKWKHQRVLPTPEQLFKFSTGTRIDYLDLLTAALVGRGYLPNNVDVEIRMRPGAGEFIFNRDQEEVMGNAEHPAPTKKRRPTDRERGSQKTRERIEESAPKPGGKRSRPRRQGDDDTPDEAETA